MHCLYCDRPLALLKRLTGDGDFCSKEHRKIYQREHNQLALERLLETQPASNKKAGPRKSQSDIPGASPISSLKASAEPVPEPADFLSSYPLEAAAVFGLRKVTGDPRFVGVAPAWGPEDRKGPVGQPRVAVFQAESFDPRAFAATVRIPGQFGFQLAQGLPSYLSTIQVPPNFRPETFLDGFVPPQTIPDRIQGMAPDPRWQPGEPALPRQIAGGIVLVTGSFLRWPVVPAVVEDVLPESFEIRLQPVSFPPFSPRMACLEERLHRTDRIGLSPP
jgi:hypothetical protein